MLRLLFATIIVAIANITVGQSFYIRFDDSEETLKDGTTLTISHETNTLIQEHFYIHNLSDHDVDMTVQRYDSILPVGFESMFCLNVCLTPEITEATHTVVTGDSVFFTVDLYSYDLTGDALIEYTVTSEPDQDTIHFFVMFEVTSVGIQDQNQPVFSIYPNPAKKFIYFENEDKMREFTIYNTSGQVVKSEKLRAHERNIDISQLANGMYFLKTINAENEIASAKFLKR